MNTENMKKPAKWPHILSIVIGLMLMFLPKFSAIASISLQIVLGWFLTLAAVFQITLLIFSKNKKDIASWLLAIVFLIIGLYFLFNPAHATLFMTWIFAAMALVSGIGNIVQSFIFHGNLRLALMLNGFLGIAFALMIYASWPFSGMTFIGVML